MMKKVLLTAVLACCSLACGGMPAEQKTAAEGALKALRRLEAATQVKPSRADYDRLLIETKAAVNEANATLPEGDLKRAIDSAMDAYTDASLAWAGMRGGVRLRDDREPGKTLAPKYGFHLDSTTAGTLEYMERLEGLNNPNYERPHERSVLGRIWSVAGQHVDRAAALSQKGGRR